MSAHLFVRPMPKRADNYRKSSEAVDNWDSRAEQVRGFLANTRLVEHLSLNYGGMFGDWRERGLIPELPALDLADLPLDEWQRWHHMMLHDNGPPRTNTLS